MSRSVRVAVIDSGVHATHPHVNGISFGVGIDATGRLHDDYIDRLGHGTAVAAVIREKAPQAELLIAKVFDRELSTTGQALVRACQWADEQRAQIVNLSLGTSNADHADALASVLTLLRSHRAVVVAAGRQDEVLWLPGTLPGAWSVTLDWSVPRDECRVTTDGSDAVSFRASGYPRPIPGVPVERNVKGLSFAVANVTGIIAALCQREGSDDPYAVVEHAVASGWRGAAVI